MSGFCFSPPPRGCHIGGKNNKHESLVPLFITETWQCNGVTNSMSRWAFLFPLELIFPGFTDCLSETESVYISGWICPSAADSHHRLQAHPQAPRPFAARMCAKRYCINTCCVSALQAPRGRRLAPCERAMAASLALSFALVRVHVACTLALRPLLTTVAPTHPAGFLQTL